MKGFLYSLGINRKTFSSNFIPIVAILITSVITTTPKFFVELYVLVLWTVFFLYEFQKNIGANQKIIRLFILGITFIFICVIYKYFGISSAEMGYCIHAPLLYFAPLVALMYIDRCDNEQQIRFLFHLLALGIAINIADNIRLTYQLGLDNITYQRFSGMMEEEGITGLNLGGSMFVNMSVFYACIVFMAYLKANERFEKILFFIYVCISVYFITFCSLKASALVLMIISLIIMYVSVRIKGRIKENLTFITIVGAFLFLFRDIIIHFFIDVIDSDRMTARMIVFTTEHDLEDSGTLMGRSGLWQVSIDSWLSNARTFFFGIGDHNWQKLWSTADSGIGNHSDLFDVLGRYGILGASILYSSIKAYYDYLQEKYGSWFKYEIIAFFILILGMGFTKKIINAQSAIVIFILFPLTLGYFQTRNNE